MNPKEIGEIIKNNRPELRKTDRDEYEIDFTKTMDAINSAWNRRQEAKPLTVDSILIKAAMEYGHKRWQVESWDTPGKKEIDYMVEEVSKQIHAALPPDQSARISELQSQRDKLLEALISEHDRYALNKRNSIALHLKLDTDCSMCNFIKAFKENKDDNRNTALERSRRVLQPD